MEFEDGGFDQFSFDDLMDIVSRAAPTAQSPAPTPAPNPLANINFEREPIYNAQPTRTVISPPPPPPAPAPAPAPAFPQLSIGDLGGPGGPLDLSKYGWTGGDPYTYEYVEGGGEAGTGGGLSATGVSDEFSKWAHDQGLTFKAYSPNPNVSTWDVYKNGQLIDRKVNQVSGLDRFLNTAVPAAIMGVASGGLGTALGGGLSGALGAGALAGGSQAGLSGGDLGDILTGAAKGAASGAIGQGIAGLPTTGNQYIDNAIRNVATQEASSVLSGKGLVDPTDALLTSVINTGIGQAAGAAGIDPNTIKTAAPAVAAIISGKDPTTAILGSLLNQGISSVSDYFKNAAAPDTGDETERLLARYPAPAPAPAAQSVDDQLSASGVQPEETTQPTVEDILNTVTAAPAAPQLPSGFSDWDSYYFSQLFPDMFPAAPATAAQEQTAESTEQQIDPQILELLNAEQPASIDTPIYDMDQEPVYDMAAPDEQTQEITPVVKPPEESGNLEQDFVVTPDGIRDTAGNYGDFNPTTGEWQPYVSVLEGLDLPPPDNSFDVIGQREEIPADYTEDLWASKDLAQPSKEPIDVDELIRQMSVTEQKQEPEYTQEQAKQELIDQQEEPAIPDYTQDLFPEEQPIETKTLTDEDIANMPGAGNLDQDYAVTDTGKIIDTSTGQTGIFDETGQWSPDYDIGPLTDLGEKTGEAEITGIKDQSAAQDALDLLNAGYGNVKPEPIQPLDLSSALDEFNKAVDQQTQEQVKNLPDFTTQLENLLKTTEEKKTDTGKPSTEKPSTTTPSTAKSGDDLSNLLLALAMMSQGQQQAPAPQQLFHADTDLRKIFGNYFA